MKTVVADLESDGLLPDLTRIHCLAVSGTAKTDCTTLYADHPGYPPLAEGLQRLTDADRVVFHNGNGFDVWALRKIYGNDYLFRTKLWDTLTVSRLVYADKGKHSLEVWGDYFKFPKGDYAKQMKAKGLDPWASFSDEMGRYCVQDVEVTKRIYRHLQGRLKHDFAQGWDWREAIQLEHDVAWIIAQQEQHGFRIDLNGCVELAAELSQEKSDIEADLALDFPTQAVPATQGCVWNYKARRWHMAYEKPKRKMRRWVVCEFGSSTKRTKAGTVRGYYEHIQAHDPEARTGAFVKIEFQDFNPGSRQQCVQRLTQKYKWRPTKFTDTGQPAVDEKVLAELRYPEAQKLLRSFRLGKQLGMLSDGKNAWLKLERDGRIHGAVNSNGTVTGRMSHFAPNVAQVDKKDLRMRAVWLPDVGQKLVGIDADGLELRMLAHYLFALDNGDYARTVAEGNEEDGTDAHTRTQLITELFARNSAKTLIYAFLYGAGDPKLGMTIHNDAREAGHKPKQAKTPAGKKARAQLEKGITGLGSLIKKIKARARSIGRVRGLDGRMVYVRSEHSALNTLLQSAGGLVMKKALVIAHYETGVANGWVNPETMEVTGYSYCANVHDEWQISSPPDIAEAVGSAFSNAITEAGVRFGLRCPLAGSCDIGDNWKETH